MATLAAKLDGARDPEWQHAVVAQRTKDELTALLAALGGDHSWVAYTIVNGEVTFEDGVCIGATPGKLVRHGRG